MVYKKSRSFAPRKAAAVANVAATTLTLDNVTGLIAGSIFLNGATRHTVSAINTTSKVVTFTPALVAAIALNAVVNNPLYDAKAGEGWAKISASDTFSGITNYTTNEVSIPADAVLNYETFKCCITDTDAASGTKDQTVSDIISFADLSDPITIDIAAPAGNILKNGVGSITLKAKVWRAGTEIDADGSTYDYQWYKYDQNGTVDGAFSKTTKTITVGDADVNGKATFECILKSK